MQKSTNVRKWNLDTAHSNLEFVVRHMMISSVRGRFRKFDGEFNLDLDDIGKSSVEVTVDAKSIFTNEDSRDDDLRSQKFLAVDSYPVLKFQSTRMQKTGNKLEVDGNLTIRGVTKKVRVTGELQGPITDPYGKKRVGFDGAATINRKDFGLTWNMVLEGGGLMVGDNVKIEIHMELTLD